MSHANNTPQLAHSNSQPPTEPEPNAPKGVEHAGVIDFLGFNRVAEEVLLVIVEKRQWTDIELQLFQLQEKLNAYLSFALDGEMADAYPDFVGKPLRVRLRRAPRTQGARVPPTCSRSDGSAIHRLRGRSHWGNLRLRPASRRLRSLSPINVTFCRLRKRDWPDNAPLTDPCQNLRRDPARPHADDWPHSVCCRTP